MTISPGNYDLTIYQGATFSHILTWRDASGELVDLSGCSARMMARTSMDANTPFISLTTENDGINLGGSAGTITLLMNATSTAALTAEGGMYDLEIISSGGIVTRLLQGNIFISREVTR